MLAWLVASSLAMAHTELGGFRVNIGGLYIVWLAPQNPYLDNGRIMFPLEGLIHVTRGMENFRIEIAGQEPPYDPTYRLYEGEGDFQDFVKANPAAQTLTVRLPNRWLIGG